MSTAIVVNNGANINAAGGDGIRACNYEIRMVRSTTSAERSRHLMLAPCPGRLWHRQPETITVRRYVHQHDAGSVDAGGSGISALNRAVSTASLPSVESTGVVSVLAFGTMNSRRITADTTTAVKDPAAGILAQVSNPEQFRYR